MTTPPPDASTPPPSATAATSTTAQDTQLASLANTIAAPPSAPPNAILKGTITAVQLAANPPTVSLTLSGDPTVIAGAYFVGAYTPVVGDTVQVQKQGAVIWVLGQLLDGTSGAGNGWVAPVLGTGISTNGNSQGNFQMRMVFDNGERKVQLQGGIAIAAGQTAVGTIPAGMLPLVGNRTLICPRDGGGSIVVQCYFNADGTITLAGGVASATAAASTTGSTTPGAGPTASPLATATATGASTGSATLGNSGSPDHPSTSTPSPNITGTKTDANTSNASTGTAHVHDVFGHAHDLQNHEHGMSGHVHDMSSHSHTVSDHNHAHDHTHTGAAHTHTTPAVTPVVTAPTWVGFNGLFYFV